MHEALRKFLNCIIIIAGIFLLHTEEGRALRPKKIDARKIKSGRKIVRRLRKIRRHTHKHMILKISLSVILFLLVMKILLSFVTFGSSIFLSMASEYFYRNFGVIITDNEYISGNPAAGYDIQELVIGDTFSAQNFSGRPDILSFLHKKFKLYSAELDGAVMDIDKIFLTLPRIVPDQIPFNKLIIKNSALISKIGVLRVSSLVVDVKDLTCKFEASLNNIDISGFADLDLQNGLALERLEINFDGTKLIATGGFVNKKIDLHATIDNIKLKTLAEFFKNLDPNDYDGTANLNISLEGLLNDLRASAAINYKGTKIYNLPVERMSANLNYSSNVLSVNNIQASLLNIPVNGDIKITLSDPSVFTMKISGTEGYLNGLEKIFNMPELKDISGKVSSFNANISGSFNSPAGFINFEAPRILYKSNLFRDVRAQIKFNNTPDAYINGKFIFNNAQGYVQGNINNILFKPRLNLAATISELDIKHFERYIPDSATYNPSGNITAMINISGKLLSPVFSGSIASQKFSWADYEAYKPVIYFAYADDKLTVLKSEGTLKNLHLAITGSINKFSTYDPELNIDVVIEPPVKILDEYVKHIEGIDFKGSIKTGFRISGRLLDPEIKKVMSSKNFYIGDFLTAVNLDITADNKGTSKDVELDVKADNVSNLEISLNNFKSRMKIIDGEIILKSFQAEGYETEGELNYIFNKSFDLSVTGIRNFIGILRSKGILKIKH